VALLLVDLDNTLIDRSAAFGRWAREFASARGGSTADAHWLVAADREGLEPRERLAAIISERFGLDDRTEAELLVELRGGLIRQVVPDAAVARALRDARAAAMASGSEGLLSQAPLVSPCVTHRASIAAPRGSS
jgi:putative hydrolase of the HAD superfamily